ncbi:hypothetical protein DVH24_014501 [Malus domestica]|uniref:Uncharacterized protein n=1 Tax=Malus domestica TaxID=3750 RepID=A0A498KQF9_MALDO|nr:hypothetical protein DVH24_014501 [Malus domestica]
MRCGRNWGCRPSFTGPKLGCYSRAKCEGSSSGLGCCRQSKGATQTAQFCSSASRLAARDLGVHGSIPTAQAAGSHATARLGFS